jgi:hypothetical protein
MDLILSEMTMTPLRNTRVAFAEPYFGSGKSALIKKENVASLQSTEVMNSPDVTVAALKGSTSQLFVDRVAPQATLVLTRLRPGDCPGAGRQMVQGFLGFRACLILAAAVVVLVAAAVFRRHVVSPVVLVSGVLPLGAVVAMFNAIVELMKVSSHTGEMLSGASVALGANVGKVSTTSLAIALGLEVGISIVRLFRREEVRDGV